MKPLTMQEVSAELDRLALAREHLLAQEDLYEQMMALRVELDWLEPYATLLELPATAYIIESLMDPEIMRMLRREMFPASASISASYHANGPTVQALWACAGLDPDLGSVHNRVLEGSLDLQDRVAVAVLASYVVEMIQDLQNRLQFTGLSRLTPAQQRNLVLGGFNSPVAWIDRFHACRRAASMQMENHHQEESNLRVLLREVNGAIHAAPTWERICQQVPQKVAHIKAEITRRELCVEPLPGESIALLKARQAGLPRKPEWIKAVARELLPRVKSAPHGTCAPHAQLRQLVNQQRALWDLAERVKQTQQQAVGSGQFAQFLHTPVAQFVLDSLMGLDLVGRLCVEFEPVSFGGAVEYQLQSPSIQPPQGVALGMLIQSIHALDPGLGLWDAVREDVGAPGVITCIAGASLALHCATLHEHLYRRARVKDAPVLHYSDEDRRSIILSGFQNPEQWELAFGELAWIVDASAPPSLATHHMEMITREASRALTIDRLREEIAGQARSAQEKFVEASLGLGQVREQIAHSIVALESAPPERGQMVDFEGAKGGRALMVRLLKILGMGQPEAVSVT